MTDIIETITLDEFYSQALYKTGAQLRAVKEMVPGKVLVFTHEGYKDCGIKVRKSCSLGGSISQITRKLNAYRFSVRHLRDGRIGVACFPKNGVNNES